MIIKIQEDGKTNSFSGDEIESLEMEDGILADYWTLTLKDGRVLRIGKDWRGNECYISLYDDNIH